MNNFIRKIKNIFTSKATLEIPYLRHSNFERKRSKLPHPEVIQISILDIENRILSAILKDDAETLMALINDFNIPLNEYFIRSGSFHLEFPRRMKKHLYPLVNYCAANFANNCLISLLEADNSLIEIKAEDGTLPIVHLVEEYPSRNVEDNPINEQEKAMLKTLAILYAYGSSAIFDTYFPIYSSYVEDFQPSKVREHFKRRFIEEPEKILPQYMDEFYLNSFMDSSLILATENKRARF